MGGGLAAAASAPPLSSLATAPEAELVKRGRKAAASAAVAASAAASAVPSAGKGTKAATKREAEAERKELLKGLDAVMEDLQRRADDRRRKELEEREVLAKGKGKAKGAKEPVAAVSGGETKALGDGSAAGGRKKQAGAVVGGEEAAMAMAAASKLTIPLLKSFIGGINERALPAGKAKKEEYVRTASELLVEKAKASGSMAEALKSLPSK